MNHKKYIFTVLIVLSIISLLGTYWLLSNNNTSYIKMNMIKGIDSSIIKNADTISNALNNSMVLESVSEKHETKMLANHIVENNLIQIDAKSNELQEIQKVSIQNEIEKQKEIERQKQLKKKKQQEREKQNNSKNDIITINGQKYRIIEVLPNMHITAYDNGYQSTGKRPGDKGYGITASGKKTGWGTAAIDRRYHNFGDMFYIVNDHPTLKGKPNGKIFIAHDTGGAIKGKQRMDIWFSSYNEAIQFGTQYMKVYKIEKVK